MFDHLKADFGRIRKMGYRGSYLRAYLETQGLWALVCYRFGRHQVEHPLPQPLRFLVSIFYYFWWYGVQATTGIYLSPNADIGPGFYIGHFGQIFVGPGCVFGRNCNISQGVTVGVARRGGNWGTPVIGERVYLAPGCKIIGPIRLADGTVVGANAVMSRDSVEDSVWAGIPARMIAKTGSDEYMGDIDLPPREPQGESTAESSEPAAPSRPDDP